MWVLNFKCIFFQSMLHIIMGSPFLPLKKDNLKFMLPLVNPWSQWAGWDLASCWCLRRVSLVSSLRYDHRLGLPPRQAASRWHRSPAPHWSPADHAPLWLAGDCTHRPVVWRGMRLQLWPDRQLQAHNLTLHSVQRLGARREERGTYLGRPRNVTQIEFITKHCLRLHTTLLLMI